MKSEVLPKINFALEAMKETNTEKGKFNFEPFINKKETSLVSKVNLQKLKAKYVNEEIVLQKRDYEMFQEENQDNLFSKTVIARPVNDVEHLEDFNRQKMEALDMDIVKPEKLMKGWGDWTGFGVKEKQIDVEKERKLIEMKIVT